MESKALLHLLEKMEPGIVLFDDAFSISYINQALMLIFTELSKEQIFGRNLLQMHSAHGQGKLTEVFRLMKDSTRQVPFSIKRMRSDSHGRFLLMKLMPLLGKGQQDSLNCCLVYDITPFIATPQHTFIKVPVTSGSEIHLVDPADILFVKAENVYSKVVTSQGEYFCDLSLGTLEEGLAQDRFYRIHRSYLINIGKVKKVIRETSTHTLIMENNETRLPISRNRANAFLSKIGLK
jgi:PAS domain S-box-containing protein